jgi:3-methyladenine DNA glycosylase/8-oxoguanine DNA glycosylase
MEYVETVIQPIPPFNFDGTVYVPAYFPTPDFEWQPGMAWQTLNLGGTLYGLKMQNTGLTNDPEIKLTIFSENMQTPDIMGRIVEELNWRYGFNEDISEFLEQFRNDRFLEPVFKRWRGMRANCANSLYELMMISIVLQNSTAKRTIQMMNNLFNAYGSKLRFDDKELLAYWNPEDLSNVAEEELRALKVGYRAKMIKRVSEAFARCEIDETKLRKTSTEDAKKELMKLYGVGPATAQIILSGYLRRYDTFELKGRFWEQKILSRALFGRKLVSPDRITSEFEKRYGKWRGLAFHYIFSDLFWRNKEEKIPWLEKEIRR